MVIRGSPLPPLFNEIKKKRMKETSGSEVQTLPFCPESPETTVPGWKGRTWGVDFLGSEVVDGKGREVP